MSNAQRNQPKQKSNPVLIRAVGQTEVGWYRSDASSGRIGDKGGSDLGQLARGLVQPSVGVCQSCQVSLGSDAGAGADRD